jgi:Ca2+/H+ antiporter, TMEM165/GDT1 family
VNFAVVATVFGLIALAELPDKTMIATVVLGSRGRPLPVWLGASAAFTVHVALAVLAGRLLQLLPHRTLEIVIAVIFGAGALYLLLVPERSEIRKGEDEAADTAAPSGWKLALGAFGVILVGEFGDLTQLLVINLEAHYLQPLSVFIGALAALVSVSAIAAFGGKALVRLVPVATIRRIGGVVLLGFFGYSLYALLR